MTKADHLDFSRMRGSQAANAEEVEWPQLGSSDSHLLRLPPSIRSATTNTIAALAAERKSSFATGWPAGVDSVTGSDCE